MLFPVIRSGGIGAFRYTPNMFKRRGPESSLGNDTGEVLVVLAPKDVDERDATFIAGRSSLHFIGKARRVSATSDVRVTISAKTSGG